jgi:heme exporter protein D
MITSGAQWSFIWAAYGITGLVMAALVAWVVLGARHRARALADLEARGLKRRSEQS